jgi:hypothetical protein
MLAWFGGRAKRWERYQRWPVFMYSCLQRERSLLECLWVFSALGLDRRPDLEWRLIARYRQTHKQPKLYLDAVGCQPGAVLAVRPQSVYVRSASLLHCRKLIVHHAAWRACFFYSIKSSSAISPRMLSPAMAPSPPRPQRRPRVGLDHFPQPSFLP